MIGERLKIVKTAAAVPSRCFIALGQGNQILTHFLKCECIRVRWPIHLPRRLKVLLDDRPRRRALTTTSTSIMSSPLVVQA